MEENVNFSSINVRTDNVSTRLLINFQGPNMMSSTVVFLRRTGPQAVLLTNNQHQIHSGESTSAKMFRTSSKSPNQSILPINHRGSSKEHGINNNINTAKKKKRNIIAPLTHGKHMKGIEWNKESLFNKLSLM